jgi:hypothetical protein
MEYPMEARTSARRLLDLVDAHADAIAGCPIDRPHVLGWGGGCWLESGTGKELVACVSTMPGGCTHARQGVEAQLAAGALGVHAVRSSAARDRLRQHGREAVEVSLERGEDELVVRTWSGVPDPEQAARYTYRVAQEQRALEAGQPASSADLRPPGIVHGIPIPRGALVVREPDVARPGRHIP